MGMQRNRKSGAGSKVSLERKPSSKTVEEDKGKIVITDSKGGIVTTIIKPGLEDNSNELIFRPVQELVSTVKATVSFNRKSGKKGKSGDAVSAIEAAFKGAKFKWLATTVGISTKDGERVLAGFDDDMLITELEDFWKSKDDAAFQKRIIIAKKAIESIHNPNFQAILDKNSDCTIAEAQNMLLELFIAQMVDKGFSYAEIKTIGELTEPFRYYAMRVGSDFIKTRRFSELDALSHSNDTAFNRVIDGATVSLSDIPEHRQVFKEIWNWFASYKYSRAPYFMT